MATDNTIDDAINGAQGTLDDTTPGPLNDFDSDDDNAIGALDDTLDDTEADTITDDAAAPPAADTAVSDQIAAQAEEQATSPTAAAAAAAPGVTIEVGEGPSIADSPAVVAAPPERPENLAGTTAVDDLTGAAGADIIDGLAGNDTIDGLEGNDVISGGDGDDRITGGTGNDTMHGGTGADTFPMDPNAGGNDVVRDFDVAEDTVELETGALIDADPSLAQPDAVPQPLIGAAPSITAADLDTSTTFSITQSPDAFVTINSPGGTLELQQVAFSDTTNSFAELPFVTIVDTRPLGSQVLAGADSTEENIVGGAGNDVLSGGLGPDNFFINPNNVNDGNDIFSDFNPDDDIIAMEIANLQAADPAIAEADPIGDPNVVELTDLDASEGFFVFPSGSNEVGIAHPNGSAIAANTRFDTDTDTFSELNFFELRDTIEEPTPEQEAINGFIEETAVPPILPPLNPGLTPQPLDPGLTPQPLDPGQSPIEPNTVV